MMIESSVVFHRIPLNALDEKKASLINALEALPALNGESLAAFRGKVSASLTCKVVSLSEMPKFLVGLVNQEAISGDRVTRFEVVCEYGESFEWGQKKVLSMPVFRYLNEMPVDFLPHIIWRTGDDRFEVWYRSTD